MALLVQIVCGLAILPPLWIIWASLTFHEGGIAAIGAFIAMVYAPYTCFGTWITGRVAQRLEEGIGKACCWAAMVALAMATAAGVEFGLLVRAENARFSDGILSAGFYHYLGLLVLIVLSALSAMHDRKRRSHARRPPPPGLQ